MTLLTWLAFFSRQVTMTDRGAAERACKDPNPIIDGRKANVNLAYLGAKPRSPQTGKSCLHSHRQSAALLWGIWFGFFHWKFSSHNSKVLQALITAPYTFHKFR